MVATQLMPVDIQFQFTDHINDQHSLDSLMGENGLILAFAEDVWEVKSIRYVLWLQRQVFKLRAMGINCALVMPNQQYEVEGFFNSIPRKISFPLLADPTCKFCDYVGMEKSGYLVLNGNKEVVRHFYVGETTTISLKSMLYYLK